MKGMKIEIEFSVRPIFNTQFLLRLSTCPQQRNAQYEHRCARK